jgi:hypothetical protein
MLTVMPLVCTKLLRKKSGLAMRPLGAWGGAARRISARPAAGMAGGVAGEGLGFTRDRFVCLHAAGRGPAGGHGGDRRRWPLEALPGELMAQSGQQLSVEALVVF